MFFADSVNLTDVLTYTSTAIVNVSVIFLTHSLVKKPVYRSESTRTSEVEIVVLTECQVEIGTVQGIFGVIRECFERKKLCLLTMPQLLDTLLGDKKPGQSSAICNRGL